LLLEVVALAMQYMERHELRGSHGTKLQLEGPIQKLFGALNLCWQFLFHVFDSSLSSGMH